MDSVYIDLALVALAAMLSPTTLSFSVLALVLGERPLRTGFSFLLGALAATISIGVLAALVLGDALTSSNPSVPRTPVAVIDAAAGVWVAAYTVRLLKRPREPRRAAAMVERMSKLASRSMLAIAAAGAALANPGGFIPLALKDISETNPDAAKYLGLWIAFTLVSLLPLTVAVVMVGIAPEPTRRVLLRMRRWLERNARLVAALILLLLAASLLRAGIAGLTS